RLAMVNMADRPNVAVRLRTVELLFGHCLLPSATVTVAKIGAWDRRFPGLSQGSLSTEHPSAAPSLATPDVRGAALAATDDRLMNEAERRKDWSG
ncbi:hypothetical protein LGR54_24215, partial [Ancylobacter sp. Lp-2]|uniref:hypothetical protein n=1 Tax=Ancylobacter sp. Lp-2 TaxID=2881339 RepID=UPI001E5E6637